MACDIITSPGAIFALWGKPTRDDMDRLLQIVRTALQSAGGPITFVARVPVHAPPPDAAVRRHLDTIMPEFIQACSGYHAVLEGSGFVAALKRGILRSLFQMRWRSDRFFVHQTVDEVRLRVKPSEQQKVVLLLDRAQSLGLLDARACSADGMDLTDDRPVAR